MRQTYKNNQNILSDPHLGQTLNEIRHKSENVKSLMYRIVPFINN